MEKDKFYELVRWDSRESDYSIDYPINNQTFHISFQLVDVDDKDLSKIRYYNVWINLYNKRKDMMRNEDLHISTGLNPIKTVLVARKCFKAIEQIIIEQMERNKKDVVIYCHWVDNRRRDAYYKVLSKWGYRYGHIPIEPNKVIMKKFKYKDYYGK